MPTSGDNKVKYMKNVLLKIFNINYTNEILKKKKNV